MKKTIAALILSLIMTGCGHNIFNYSDGIGLETTFRPDSGNFGITFRYGKILSVVARENTEVEMTGEGQGAGNADGGNGTAASSGSVKIKIGKQINGYTVEALKQGVKLEDLQKAE